MQTSCGPLVNTTILTNFFFFWSAFTIAAEIWPIGLDEHARQLAIEIQVNSEHHPSYKPITEQELSTFLFYSEWSLSKFILILNSFIIRFIYFRLNMITFALFKINEWFLIILFLNLEISHKFLNKVFNFLKFSF